VKTEGGEQNVILFIQWFEFLWHLHKGILAYTSKSITTTFAAAASNKYILYSCIRASQYDSGEITNKMQPCNRIYYSNVY
jgi:hypothetical protein